MKKLLAILVLSLLLHGCAEKSSKLPILECIIDNPSGSKATQIYDLTEIERLDPTNNLEGDEREAFAKRDGEHTALYIFENEYRIHYNNIRDGILNGYMVNIKRDSGMLEGTFFEPYDVNISWTDLLEVMSKAQIFNGVCEKKKRKNL